MGYTLQFCQGDRDTTSEPFAEDHADEVRVWMEGADEPVRFFADFDGWFFNDAYASGYGFRTYMDAMNTYSEQVPECGF
jgi:hypothetical protein